MNRGKQQQQQHPITTTVYKMSLIFFPPVTVHRTKHFILGLLCQFLLSDSNIPFQCKASAMCPSFPPNYNFQPNLTYFSHLNHITLLQLYGTWLIIMLKLSIILLTLWEPPGWLVKRKEVSIFKPIRDIVRMVV